MLEIEINDGDGDFDYTISDCIKLSRNALSKGMWGYVRYWDGMRFLLQGAQAKTAHTQARRLVISWCHFARAEQLAGVPKANKESLCNARFLLQRGVPVWLADLEEPKRAQLEKATTRKRTHFVSRKAVAEFDKFRSHFTVAIREFDELDTSMFFEGWCLPSIDKYLDRWCEQLAFVESRMVSGD